MDLTLAPWLRILTPTLPPFGRVRHALFDFDGTLSVLRQGWEPIMTRVMLSAICGQSYPHPAIHQEVTDYIDRSTGILTILQMEWLVDAVHRHNPDGPHSTAAEYKSVYRQVLLDAIATRLQDLEQQRVSPECSRLAGAADFLSHLARRGVSLYLASGSDHDDVLHEVELLGLTPFFTGGIYGALDASEANGKERVIQHILDTHHLGGDELVVIGDGPVEIIEARKRSALALGIASDEVERRGWNEYKARRLANAGADCLVADFSQADQLASLLTGIEVINADRSPQPTE